MRTDGPRSRFMFSACLILGLAVCGSASAQDPLSAARAELDAARFEDALRLYDALASADAGLDRGALVRLLRDRALARAALRDHDGARADLTALFSLDPEAQLGDEAPPSLRVLAEEVRTQTGAPLAVRAEASPVDGGYVIRTEVEGDPAGVLREIRIRELRDGGVETHTGERVHVATDGALRYVVEAVGWGGAVVASIGTPTSPRIIGPAASPMAPPPPDGDDDVGLWVGVGVGAGVAVALAVVLAVVLTMPSDTTQPGVPMEVR